MTPIADAVALACAQPAPILVIDTCSLLDLFRRDNARHRPRSSADEIQAAAALLPLAASRPAGAHLIAPELVPGEFADHADRIEQEFADWFAFHDENQTWLVEAARSVGQALPVPHLIRPSNLQRRFRRLAEDLLAQALVLARDQTCLDRAVARLIAKRRPSHKKEMKDSMNLEQALELAAQLRNAAFSRARVFVSSNTNDFAESPTSHRLHPDLQAEFATASLEYFNSLWAAVGALRGRGEIP
jgi:hypothetical protein